MRRAGWQPPFAGGTSVRRFNAPRDMNFVRVHSDPNRAQGGFLTRASAVRGKSPEQIRQMLGLKQAPRFVTDVNVPQGTPIKMGRVGAQPRFGIDQNGGFQYVLNGADRRRCQFTNTRPIGESL